MDIALVFGLDLHLFGDGGGKVGAAGVEGGQFPVAQLRAADQVGQLNAGVEGGGALFFQEGVQFGRRRDVDRFNPRPLGGDGRELPLEGVVPLFVDQAQPVADGGQPLVGVVLAEDEGNSLREVIIR